MKVEGAVGSQQTTVKKAVAPVEKKPVTTEISRADRDTVVNKFNEQSVTATQIKSQLNQKLDAQKAVPTDTTTTPPVDYFEIDKQADELIKKHTDDGFFSDSLKTDDLGRELADIAKNEPEKAAALTDNILDKIDDSDRDEVAQSMVESMSPTELRELAGNERGKEILGKLKDHLLSGSVHDDEEATAARIDNAIAAADFQDSAEFKALDSATQQEVLRRLDENQGNKTATQNLIDLAKSGEFAGLTPAAQSRILQSFDKNKEDGIYTRGLIDLAGNSRFRALNETQQNGVLNDMETFATTESYKGKEGGIFGIGSREVTDEQKTYLLGLIAGTAIYSQENPGNTTVRNTLDKILSGDVRMEAYSDNSASGQYVNGWADDGAIHMNIYANSTRTIEQQIDTYVHEINHIVNGDTDAGTPERFLDEYRARVVGREAGGRPFSADIQRQSLDQLTSGGGSYQHLNDLYNNDPKFKAVIDAVYADLNKTPPVLTTPEELRQRLLDAGFSSDYLNTPSNLDNH